jgi:hypothetical protein
MKITIILIGLILCGLPLVAKLGEAKKPKEYIAHFEVTFEIPDTATQTTSSFGRHCVDCSAGMYAPREDGVRRCSACGKPDPEQQQ